MSVEHRSDEPIERLVSLTRAFEEFRNETRARFSGATQGLRAALKIRDLPSVVRVVMGDLDGDGVHYGFKTLLANGTTELFRTDDRGIVSPGVLVPVTPSQVGLSTGSLSAAVTSATFVNVFSGLFPTLLWQGMSGDFPWATDAATTGELRINVTALPASNTSTSALTLAAAGSGVAILHWLHGITVPSTSVQVNIQARRTGGAGNVNIYWPVGGVALLGPAGMNAAGSEWN